MINIIFTLLVICAVGYIIYYYIKKNQNAEVEQQVNVDDKTYTLEKMTEFVKKRLNEITKNLGMKH